MRGAPCSDPRPNYIGSNNATESTTPSFISRLNSINSSKLKPLAQAIYEAAVEEAGLCNIAKCPICDFTAMCDDRVFRCPAVGCGYESCRECGEPPHFPLKCSEVEKTSHAESRKKIEEAMTQARVRECPDCGKRFFKTEGCNKMSCSCGGLRSARGRA